MAGVQDTNVIDLVGEGPDGEVILFIVEERPRDASRSEESDADLARYQKWLAAISARDYFDAPGREKAVAAVALM